MGLGTAMDLRLARLPTNQGIPLFYELAHALRRARLNSGAAANLDIAREETGIEWVRQIAVIEHRIEVYAEPRIRGRC